MTMALPNKDTRTTPKIRRRRKWNCYSLRDIMAAIVALILLFVFMKFHIDRAIKIAERHHQHQLLHASNTTNNLRRSIHQDKKSIKMLEALPEEKSFWKTLKQCLPQQNQKKCSTFVPENGRQRIGFLAPPGHMTNTFLHLIQAVLNQSEAQKIDLIPTTSMAPYGYGKTQ